MNESPQNEPSPKHKVSTWIARVVILIFGVGLLALSILCRIWENGGFLTKTLFGAFIGACLGYGLGGDIWSARMMDLFTGLKIRRLVEADSHHGVPAYVGRRFTLVMFAIVGLGLLGVLAWYLLKT